MPPNPHGQTAWQLPQEDIFHKTVSAGFVAASVVAVKVELEGEPGDAWLLDSLDVSGDPADPAAALRFPYFGWLRAGADGRAVATIPASARRVVEYAVAVRTADWKGAGTDANVYITLHGTEGSTCERRLEVAADCKAAFERGGEDVFVLPSVDVGGIERITLRHDGTGVASRWRPSTVTVRLEAQSHLFCCDHWMESSEASNAMDFAVLKAAPAEYTLTVRTADAKNAGTEADVYVRLFGEGGDSGDQLLARSTTNAAAFERGQEDVFWVKCARDVGKILRVEVKHEPAGADADK